MSNTTQLSDLYSGQIKNSLKSHIKYHGLVQKIASSITLLPEFQRLKTGSSVDHELVSVCANIVEDYSNGNKAAAKIDKQNLVVDAITKCFQLNPDEITTLRNQIQYLYNNNLIQKTKLSRKIFCKASSIIKSFISSN